MLQTIACPACSRTLNVPEEFHGKKVQCPECKHIFIAGATPFPPEAPGTAVQSEAPAPMPPPADAPADPEQWEKPRRRILHEEEDDDFITRPRYAEPHRAGTVLALGIAALAGGLICCFVPLVLGPMSWIFGTVDLKKMDAGFMDPQGRGQTKTGMILGIVATLLYGIGLILYVVFIVMIMAMQP